MLNPEHDQHENGADQKCRVEMHDAKAGDLNAKQLPRANGGCCRPGDCCNRISRNFSGVRRVSKPSQHLWRCFGKERNGEQGVENIARCNGATQR